jgi:hypothetical protein
VLSVMVLACCGEHERPASEAEGESEAEARTVGTEYEAARAKKRKPFSAYIGNGFTVYGRGFGNGFCVVSVQFQYGFSAVSHFDI